MSSPKKKKVKIDESSQKKQTVTEEHSSKRLKVEHSESEVDDLAAKRRKNFVPACEQVSKNAYFDYRTRLQLVYLPKIRTADIKEMPSYTEESVKIEMKTNMWCEALEVCLMCITPDQYLSANVLKDTIEIMLNAQEDEDAGYTIPYLLGKCQQVLSLNFSTHPPCSTKTLRKCYQDFLTSPMDSKEETFSNRSEFDYKKGVAKYCMNRLEYEISSKSKDEALIDKYETTPEDLRDTVKGLHWQKKKLDIYENLERPDRIQRLMAILESIIELLQFDLVAWCSRYTSNHIMRSNKPLMAYILWSNNVLYTGAVNANCRQILKLFVYMIHLSYPEDYIAIMTIWLNVIVQTFYICETNSNSDYPNTGKYCTAFAKEFYKIIAEMPCETIIRILERIQPTIMQTLVGTLHIKTLLSTQEDDIFKIFIDFLKKSQWKKFPENDSEIKVTKMSLIKPKKIKNILKYLIKKCNNYSETENTPEVFHNVNQKFDQKDITDDFEPDQNYVVHIFYITIEAYLDTYSVPIVQDTWDNLNQQLENVSAEMNEQNLLPELCSYSVTEQFVKKYRSIFNSLGQLTTMLRELKEGEQLPENMNILVNLGLI